ncbi:MAG: pyridoxal-phosphate dependent enzyme, partial [Acidobacteriota bacterium]|nr:pyridoxal-phosphate dependent enzyme [Acidobacteriota bacterium]
GGTLTGVALKIKEACPKCVIVGVDPVGSILAGGDHVASYKVEGIGYDFIPEVLHRDLVDVWVKTTDRPSFIMARRLIRKEGLLCGGSSGSAMYAAIKEARRLHEGQNCVVILPDGVRNYMTKFVDDKWMRDNRFIGADAQPGTVAMMTAARPKHPLVTIVHDDTAQLAIELMRKEGISQIPVVEKGELVGLLTEEDLLQFMSSGQPAGTARVSEIMNRSVPTVEESTPLSALQDLLMQSGSALVVDQRRKPITILTKIDLVEWMVSNPVEV